MIYKAVEVIWNFGTDGRTSGRESKIQKEVLADLKSRILSGCLVTPLASQKEVHLMEMLSKERSSGGWCLLGKVVTIKISRHPNIRQFNFYLHSILFRSDLKCQGDEESLENCPGK